MDYDTFISERDSEVRLAVSEWPTSVELDPDQQLLFFDRGVVEIDPGFPDPDDPDDPDDPSNPGVLGASPNPFNPRTAIRFALADDANPRLRIYDLRGRAVRTLEPGWLPAGEHRVIWEGTDDNGRSVASGNYLVRLEGAGQQRPALRITLVR